MFYVTGSYSVFPRQAYTPADLTVEGHLALRERIRRAAIWWGMDEEAAEEAASQFYAHYLGRNWGTTDIPRGDHARATASILSYAKLSHFHGFTGQRRQARGKRVERGSDGLPIKRSVRKACAAELAQRERMRQRNLPLPQDAAVGLERIQASPALRRKAERLAQRLGVSVDAMIREACGFAAE